MDGIYQGISEIARIKMNSLILDISPNQWYTLKPLLIPLIHLFPQITPHIPRLPIWDCVFANYVKLCVFLTCELCLRILKLKLRNFSIATALVTISKYIITKGHGSSNTEILKKNKLLLMKRKVWMKKKLRKFFC